MTTVLSCVSFTPTSGGMIHRCHRQTGNFTRPFVISSSCKRFSIDAFSSKVNNPSSHKIQPQDDGRLASELVSRKVRNPAALRPQRTHTVGSSSVRQRSARFSFTSVTIELARLPNGSLDQPVTLCPVRGSDHLNVAAVAPEPPPTDSPATHASDNGRAAPCELADRCWPKSSPNRRSLAVAGS